MKKIILLGLIALLIFPVSVAGQIDPGQAPATIEVENAITIIFNAAFWLLLAIAAIFFLLGAFYFLTAGQNPDNAAKGKSIITYAIIAMIVAVLAQGLATFIPRMFGV